MVWKQGDRYRKQRTNTHCNRSYTTKERMDVDQD